MKKLIALLAFTLPLVGQAQPPEGQDWWACQSVKAGGLHWKNGQWKTTGFNHDDRFILISQGQSITLESAAKAMDVGEVSCSVSYSGKVTCVGKTGTTLMFSPETGNGGISELMGAVGSSDDQYRDTLSVLAFECAKG
jgi:hypothetical protein